MQRIVTALEALDSDSLKARQRANASFLLRSSGYFWLILRFALWAVQRHLYHCCGSKLGILSLQGGHDTLGPAPTAHATTTKHIKVLKRILSLLQNFETACEGNKWKPIFERCGRLETLLNPNP